MKNKIYSFFIILLTIGAFVLFNQKEDKLIKNLPQRRLLDNLVQNKYVNEDSIITAENLEKIIYRKDVKVIKIVEDKITDKILPKTLVIKLSQIEINKDSIPGFVASKDQIGNLLSSLGITDDDTLIIYDDTSSPLATRLFFILKLYGHNDVRVLDGGADSWVRKGFKRGSILSNIKPSQYTADDAKKAMLASIEDIKENLENKDVIFLDVRSKSEYDKGHIPNAVNIWYTVALTENGSFKDYNKLKELYQNLGITENKEMIYVYCYKGSRASFTYFVLKELLGYNNVLLYDGSFVEYEKSGLPIAK